MAGGDKALRRLGPFAGGAQNRQPRAKAKGGKLARLNPRFGVKMGGGGGDPMAGPRRIGQRRFVWLQGCVQTAEQAIEAERLVRRIDDVEGVVNQLMVGTGGTPAYRVAPR